MARKQGDMSIAATDKETAHVLRGLAAPNAVRALRSVTETCSFGIDGMRRHDAQALTFAFERVPIAFPAYSAAGCNEPSSILEKRPAGGEVNRQGAPRKARWEDPTAAAKWWRNIN